ncbi:MAG: cyclase family protein [Actinobacteria bacterium]|nr:MAG: cyclase family protein [Actinomycetota bacterium]
MPWSTWLLIVPVPSPGRRSMSMAATGSIEGGEEMADTYDEWLTALAARQRFGVRDRLGTANYIDDLARIRAAESIVSGEPVSLARPMRPSPSPRGDDRPGFSVEVFYTDGPIGMGSDHVELDCHGRANTHLDALNHISIGGHWFDVPKVRGTPWADADAPVDGRDIETALQQAGVTFAAGDALLLYMGRDRYEAEGNSFDGLREGHTMPGVGRTAAEWIADNHVSMLCWDFLDSSHPSQPFVCVHRLIWAIGLLLVDNCELGAAARAASANSTAVGGLIVAPLAIPGGTGCSVRPLWLL